MPSFGLERTQNLGLIGLGFEVPEAKPAEPETAEEFAQAVIRAICHASVTPSVGRRTYERCLRALAFGSSTRIGFRHPGKADAIDLIWRDRDSYYRDYRASPDKRAFLATLPWVGPVTRSALAHQLGLGIEPDHRAVA